MSDEFKSIDELLAGKVSAETLAELHEILNTEYYNCHVGDQLQALDMVIAKLKSGERPESPFLNVQVRAKFQVAMMLADGLATK